jgi:hypothetical protein
MRQADDRTAPGSDASASRRLKFWLRKMKKCLPMKYMKYLPWYRPLRTLHRAVASSKRLIDHARGVIEAAQRSARQRPLWAARRLNQASHLLMDAADLIHRATDAALEVNACLAFAPREEQFAPQRLAEDAKRMMDAACDLTMASNELDVAVANALLLERAGYVTDSRPVIITAPPLGIGLFDDDSPRLPLRRRRSVLGTIEDAVRRVCRGRAPPMVSLCPL